MAGFSFQINKELIYQDESWNEEFEKKSHQKLRIIHFNDVYNIESRSVEPCGGSARFVNLIEHLKRDQPALVFFSGDAFSPSNCKLLSYLYFLKLF